MYIPRSVEARLLEMARFFPALVISGARQAGKTTLLRHCFPEHNYVSLDLPSVAELAARNPDGFFARHKPPVIIDEIQYAPELFRSLKRRVGEDRHVTGRYVLTGSQHFSLMKDVADSLAGRVGLLNLETLSLKELSRARLTEQAPPSRSQLFRFLSRGLYPELWRLPELRSFDFFTSYVATYLERDVRQLLNVTSLRDFERFLRILAARSGTMLNKSEIARDTGISLKAVGDWISVLEASGQIALLEPWFASFGKRVVKTPKMYLCDPGLLCFLLNISEDTLSGSPFLGNIWETLVFAELRKRIQAEAKPVGLWYYRDQRGREVDFVVETQGVLRFVEVKWQEHPDRDDARSVKAVSSDLNASSSPWKGDAHFVLGTPSASYPIDEHIRAIGVDGIDLLIE